jgi:hypothetical protein
VRAIVTWIALANLCIRTIPISASLRAVGDIAEDPSPSLLTSAFIRFIRHSVNAWWVTDWRITIGTLISIEAFTDLRCRAYSVDAALADTQTANRTGPARLTITFIWCGAHTFDAWWRAHRDGAVEACPAELALATLTFIFIIFFEALIEVR